MISVPGPPARLWRRMPRRALVGSSWIAFQNGLAAISAASQYSVTTCTTGMPHRRAPASKTAARFTTGPQRSRANGSVATAGSR